MSAARIAPILEDVVADTRDPTREELDAMAEGMRYAIGRSEQVIDGLLLLARTGIVEPTTTDLAELVGHALAEALSDIADRGMTVSQDIDRRAYILCDPCSSSGWIEIVSRRTTEEVIVRIANTGAVLDEATMARLREPFYRALAGQRDVPGTGLGLAIARSIAEAYGGRLHIDGRPGGGVIVMLSLPAIEHDRSKAT